MSIALASTGSTSVELESASQAAAGAATKGGGDSSAATTAGPDVWLAASIAVYVASSLGGVAAVKFLNYTFCFSPFLLLAMLSRCTWVLALPLHAALHVRAGRALRVPSRRQLAMYCAIGLGLSAIEAANALTMSVLPGSVYALIKARRRR